MKEHTYKLCRFDLFFDSFCFQTNKLNLKLLRLYGVYLNRTATSVVSNNNRLSEISTSNIRVQICMYSLTHLSKDTLSLYDNIMENRSLIAPRDHHDTVLVGCKNSRSNKQNYIREPCAMVFHLKHTPFKRLLSLLSGAS